jgi:phosphoglycerate dehydrogenase-like enzyme
MIASILPPPDRIVIGFAHSAYRLADEFRSRGRVVAMREAATPEQLDGVLGDVDVLVVSGFWRNAMLDRASRLRFIQSVSAGVDQYDKTLLRVRGVRLASAQGANERAVAEHALALMLALSRHLHLGRDAQSRRFWRPMIGDPSKREQEQGGRTVAVIGFGRIGQRFGRLARALGCRVIGVRRDAAPMPDAADDVIPIGRLGEALAAADVVVLACALTPETEQLVDAGALSRMKVSAHLINVARGRVVHQAALVQALADGRIAAAALDVAEEEPLPADSPLWTMPNVIITPHAAGETGRYEANVIDLLNENLDRLWRGEAELVNGIV